MLSLARSQICLTEGPVTVTAGRDGLLVLGGKGNSMVNARSAIYGRPFTPDERTRADVARGPKNDPKRVGPPMVFLAQRQLGP
jgi:hypothetical protein